MHVLLLYLTLVSPSPEQSDITSIDFCANAPKPPTKQSTQMAVNLVTWVMNEVQSRTNLDEGKLKEVFSPTGSQNNFFRSKLINRNKGGTGLIQNCSKDGHTTSQMMWKRRRRRRNGEVKQETEENKMTTKTKTV